MNREYFEKELTKKINLEEKQIALISQILEENNIIGRKSKEKIKKELKEKLETTEEQANKIYDASMEIIKDGIKEKLKHPFKSID